MSNDCEQCTICLFVLSNCTHSGMTAIATYLLTKEIWNSGAGLFAACFIAVGQLLRFLSFTLTAIGNHGVLTC